MCKRKSRRNSSFFRNKKKWIVVQLWSTSRNVSDILDFFWNCTRLQVSAQKISVNLTFNFMLKNKQNFLWKKKSNCQNDFSIRIFEFFNVDETCSWNILAIILQQFESIKSFKKKLTLRTTQQVHKKFWS